MLMVMICIPVCYVQIKLGALFKRGIVGIFSILIPILKGKSGKIKNRARIKITEHFLT